MEADGKSGQRPDSGSMVEVSLTVAALLCTRLWWQLTMSSAPPSFIHRFAVANVSDDVVEQIPARLERLNQLYSNE